MTDALLLKHVPPDPQYKSECRKCYTPLIERIKDGVVDTGYYEDYYGRVILCHLCAAEIARAVGYVSPQQLRLVQDELVREIEDLRKQVQYGNLVNDPGSLGSGLRNFLDFLLREQDPPRVEGNQNLQLFSYPGFDESGAISRSVHPSGNESNAEF